MATVGLGSMSAREAEVLDALRDHLTNAEIANKLHISVRTVESHVSSLLRKLDAADRRDLAARAAELGAGATATPKEFGGLPSRWTSFIGRTAAIEETIDVVSASRMVTLLGPGGIGKTSLAAVVAKRLAPTFAGGGAFVDLVPVSADFVIQAVATALRVIERPQEPLADVVHERLREGRVLLVLDNCEHVLAAAATFTQGVLAACPAATVLATSRERLGVTGERVVAVPPLALTEPGQATGSEAEALFVDRASAVGGVHADPTEIAEICRRLDGMPLAIELAAARSGTLGVDGLLAGLDDRLRLLSRGLIGRHQSLRAVIDWSHDLLEVDERALFRRLGVFAGAFDLASAATVAADGDVIAASDVVGRIADKSLLVYVRDEGASRWRMLETVHAYALEQLEASGETDEMHSRHLEWAAATARALEESLDDDDEWQSRFDAVADDLRAALGGGSDTTGDRVRYELGLALAHLCYARRFLVEARSHCQSAVAFAPDAGAAIVALRVAADVAYAELRGDIVYSMLTAAAERAPAAGDPAIAAMVLADAAAVGGRVVATFPKSPEHDDLVALVERASAMAPSDNLEVAVHVAIAAAWNGRPGLNEPDPLLADHALDLARQLGDIVLISEALDCVSAAKASEGQFKAASRLTAERLELLDQVRRHDPRFGGEVADMFHSATEAALAAGEVEVALMRARHAQEDSLGEGLAHFAATHFVVPLVLQGAFDEALTHAAVMRDGWERSGRPAAGWMAPAFYSAGLVHGLRGDEDQRARWWQLGQILTLRSRTNSFSVFAARRIALHHGDLERARPSAALPTQLSERFPGRYLAYAAAIAVEAEVVAGAPDAEQQLASVSPLAAENDFVAALLRRTAGRLHRDEAELLAAVAQWEAIGARFERACTLLLLPSRADEGRTELAALGCPAPAD